MQSAPVHEHQTRANLRGGDRVRDFRLIAKTRFLWAYRCFEFNKRSQLFIRAHNETLAVAMRVSKVYLIHKCDII